MARGTPTDERRKWRYRLARSRRRLGRATAQLQGRLRGKFRGTFRGRFRGQLRMGRGAAVALLVDAPQFLPAIEEALRQAREQILFENYMIASDETGMRIVTLLCERARAGVAVWAVFDAVGSFGLSQADRQRMVEAGVQLKIFNRFRWLRPMKHFLRTHRRIVVVDGELGFVGGFGFTDEWVKTAHAGPWHELVWRVHGAPLLHLMQMFAEGWPRRHRPRMLDIRPVSNRTSFWIINKTRMSGAIRRIVAAKVLRARQRIWICTGYFVPGWLLLQALKRAARRGVDVRLMLSGPKTADHKIVQYAGRRYYQGLLRAGVKIYESRTRMVHAKAAIVDNDLAAVGSSNLDTFSMHYNKEVNLLVLGREPVKDLEQAMVRIQGESTHITRQAWENRPWLSRLLERCFGIADPLL